MLGRGRAPSPKPSGHSCGEAGKQAELRQPAHKVSIVPVPRVGMPLPGMLAGSLRCAVISAGPARNQYSLIIQGLRWEPFK